MKRIHFLGVAIITAAVCSTATAQTFLKVIGDPGRAESGLVSHRSVTGEIYIAGSVNDSALVQRMDANGNVLWSRAFKPAGQLPKVVVHLSDTPDGTIIGCGSGSTATQEQVEGFHFRMDASGNMLWLRSWTDPAVHVRRIIAASATEYMVFAGINDPFPATYTDLINARIDAATGDVIGLSDRIDLYSPMPYIDDVRSAVPLGSKYYGVYGMSTTGALLTGRRVGLSTFDATGQFLDNKFLVFAGNVDRRVYPTDIVVKDDSLTIAYYGDINGSSGNWTLGLIRCDTLGNIAWARDFNIGASGQEHGTRLLATSFGYVLAGRTSTAAPNKLFLLAISNTGASLWCRSYGAPGQVHSLTDIYAYNVADMGDGFLLTGMVDQGAGDLDLLVVRTDIDGQIDCDVVTERSSITTVLPTFSYPTAALQYGFPITPDQAVTEVVDAGIADICDINVALGNDTTLCGTLTLDAGNPNATYEWQDGSTGQTFDVDASGTYWVQVSVGCCVGSDTIVVATGELAGSDLGADTLLCEGGEVILQASTGTWTFLWSDGSTDPTLIVTTEGTYWVEATDGPCSARDSIDVTVASTPTVDLGPDIVSCTGDGILLEPAVTDAEEYLWSDASTATTLQVDATGTITLEVTNTCGMASDDVEVNIVAPIVLDLGADTTICDGTTLPLEVDLPDWTLTWSDGTVGNTFGIGAEGTYGLEATNATCTLTDSIVVEVITIPDPYLGTDTVLCNGGPLLLAPLLVDVNDVLWSDGSTDQQLLVTNSGTWSITATNVCGSGTDEMQVTLVQPMALDLGNDTLLCGTGSLTLDLSTSGASLTWQDGSVEDTFLVTTPGTFWVEGDLEGCTVRDTIDVEYTQLPVLNLGPDTLSCDVPLYILDAGDEGDDAEWSDGSQGRFLVAAGSGVYWASISSYCGQVIDSVRVTFAMGVSELVDGALCPGRKVELRPMGELLGTIWSTGDTVPAITVGEGEYSYEAIDIVGCPHTDSVRVYIDQGLDGQVYIPNAFSPNKDGINEFFRVEGPERSDFELAIHDRWGGELYRTIDPYQGWDGESGPQPGVYVYTVTYRDRCAANNTLVTKRGSVTLLR